MQDEKELIGVVREVELKAKEKVLDLFAGMYHSAFKGVGIEFEELREYEAGDDIRTISWTKTAQLGRPFVKKFREERDLTVLFLFDVSASLNVQGQAESKRRRAFEIFALLALSAITNNDKVGLILFSSKIEKYVPAKRGMKHGMRLLRECIGFQSNKKRENTTNLAHALSFATKITKKRCILFVLSDFIADGYAEKFQLAAKKDDVIAIHIADEKERQPLALGLVTLQDLETGQSVLVDMDEKMAQLLVESYAKKKEEVRQIVKKAGADLIEIDTQEEYESKLFAFFKKRKNLR
jgi:uncharacterized protein (DUF58 family)